MKCNSRSGRRIERRRVFNRTTVEFDTVIELLSKKKKERFLVHSPHSPLHVTRINPSCWDYNRCRKISLSLFDTKQQQQQQQQQRLWQRLSIQIPTDQSSQHSGSFSFSFFFFFAIREMCPSSFFNVVKHYLKKKMVFHLRFYYFWIIFWVCLCVCVDQTLWIVIFKSVCLSVCELRVCVCVCKRRRRKRREGQ